MIQVSTCCCGCSLAQGTIATGILSTIESIFSIGTGINCIYGGKDGEYDDDEEINDMVKSILYTVGVISVVIGSLLLLTTIVLFCAVSTKKRSLILPWLIMRGIMLGFEIYGIYAMFRLGLNFLYILGNFVWLCLMIYMFIVVSSYYKSVLQTVGTMGQVMGPAAITSFQFVPQNPEYPHQHPVGQVNNPPISYPISNPTGQQMYPAAPYANQQPYGLQSPQPMGTPPAYPASSAVPVDELTKSAIVVNVLRC